MSTNQFAALVQESNRKRAASHTSANNFLAGQITPSSPVGQQTPSVDLPLREQGLRIEDLEAIGLSLVYDKRSRAHEWQLLDDGRQVARLAVYRHSSKHPWEIGYVETETAWRRMGLAAFLFAHATSQLGTIHHHSTRTHDGERWARSVGGRLPKKVAISEITAFG